MNKKYDVFISSKSEDYHYAEDVYNFLTSNGFITFFANKELDKIGESEYADAIDAALDATTHMIVVASSPKYVKFKWVHYEWSTFRNDLNSGYREGNLLTILIGIEPKSLPAGLRHQQSFSVDSYKPRILGYLKKSKDIAWLGVEKREENQKEDAMVSQITIGTEKIVNISSNKKTVWKHITEKWHATSNIIKLSTAIIIPIFICFALYTYLSRITDEGNYHDGMMWVKNGMGKYGFKDESGKVVIPCKLESSGIFSEGLAAIYGDNGKYGYIDKTGKIVIPYQWKSAEEFNEGFAKVKDSCDMYGFINKTGLVVIKCQWEYAWSFSEGLALVQDTCNLWGVIDKTGEIVSPCQWYSAWSFSEGMAQVQNNRKMWGYIDKTGKEVIPCKYKSVGNFHDGTAVVQDTDGRNWEIDKMGTIIREIK